MFSLLCTRTPRAFSTDVLTPQSDPRPYCCVQLFRLQEFTFIFVKPRTNLPVPIFHPVDVFLCGGSSFWFIYLSFHFGVTHKLGEGAVTLVTQQFLKILDSFGPSIHPDELQWWPAASWTLSHYSPPFESSRLAGFPPILWSICSVCFLPACT